MKKKLLLGGLFALALVLVLLWIQGLFQSKVPGGRSQLLRERGEPKTVFTVKTSSTKGQVTVTGTVEARDTAKIAARIQGYVVVLNVDAGDRVKKGDVLLRLDSKEMKDQEAQAEATLKSAQADLERAKWDFQRYKKLYDQQSISAQQFDNVRTTYQVAKAAEARARAALEQARTMLSYSVVRAPFDGVIGMREVNMGDLVTPGRELLSIYKPGTAELVAPVGEQYARYVKERTPVTVDIPSIALRRTGKIREVVPQRDPQSRTITVKVSLPERAGLEPGLYGTMTFETKASKTILVPEKAVKRVGQLDTVRVYEDGKIKIRHVKIGRAIGNRVEVLSGLRPGEKLVLD
ncbi:MAG: efflux RND transporter periplasmic adaptor subunit [Deltaproteobacteria bacterium]